MQEEADQVSMAKVAGLLEKALNMLEAEASMLDDRCLALMAIQGGAVELAEGALIEPAPMADVDEYIAAAIQEAQTWNLGALPTRATRMFLDLVDQGRS